MLMLTIETFLLLLLSGLLGLAVGYLFTCGRSGGSVEWSDDRPWLRDGRPVPAAPALGAAPTLLDAAERDRLAAALAASKATGPATPAATAAPPVGATAGEATSAAGGAQSGSAATSAAGAGTAMGTTEAAAAGASDTSGDEPVAASPAADGPVGDGAATAGAGEEQTAATSSAVDFALPEDLAAAAVTPTVAPEDSERAAAADAVGTRPMALAAPLGGDADQLTRIRGVGPQNEKKLHGLGVYHFAQIAAWTPRNAAWAGSFMAFPGRIEREDWIGQAKLLAGETATTAAPAAASDEPAVAAEETPSAPVATEPAAAEAEAATPAAASEGAAASGLPAEMAAAAIIPTVAPEDAERAAAADAVGTRPMALAAPIGGGADDLKRIRGIGPQNEKKLHGLGVYHFAQIAGWTADNARWAGSFMAFPGRIEREDWIAQAKVLASGAETEFSKRVDAGEVPSSQSQKS